MDLSALKWDAAGLVTVVVQDRVTGAVRMLAHANAEALERTVATREAHFFSRSRGALWRKGETSGNVIRVAEVWVDCDADAVIYVATPLGPSCHTGAESCFFRRLDADADAPAGPRPTELARLFAELESRREATGTRSYTRSLLDAGPAKIGAKVREEADELARAIVDEPDDRVVAECAVTLAEVERELARRAGVSGLDEKASRRG
jgi:phosphoribosyl-ATP pyrophosphohydrolase/phosphoribosyl-AMP cyclohydrolase